MSLARAPKNSMTPIPISIYDTCPILHDTQLHEVLDIKDPYDVVGKLFSAQTVFEIGAELNSEFDINKRDRAESLKKPSKKENQT